MSTFQNKLNKQEKGIWRYVNFYSEFIKPENRLVLDGAKNPTPVINIKLFENLYFKREDKNSTGSLKDRSLAYQVSLAKQNKKNKLVISTSGNAGIAAATYCQKAGIKLYIFISPETEKAKIAEMQKYNSAIIKSKRAIRLANYLSAKYKIENLRPSINNSSIEGFRSIAFEIFENLGEIDALFTFVTSGSSFVGIGKAYKYLLENNEIRKLPKLYAVQSGNIFSVTEKPSRKEMAANDDFPGKLGIKNTSRKKEILEFIKSSGGSGIYINDNDIRDAKNALEKNKIYTSPEGCAAFAGAIKASEKNKFNKAVCILSGKFRNKIRKINEDKIYKAESFRDVDKIFK